MKYLSILLILIINQASWAQEYEFIGLIMVNDTIPITYRLNFEVKDNIVTGTSLSDEQGNYETKSIIKGTYIDHLFSFKETETLYTKASFENLDFCYISFNGDVKLNKKSPLIEGEFKGLFSDNVPCLNGSIKLRSLTEITKKQDKIFKKIEKSKRIQKILNEQGIKLPKKMISKEHVNLITKNQNTGVFWKGETLKMEIWDNGKIDGDIIDVFVDGKMILKNYQISTHVKTITLPLVKKQTEIKIISKVKLQL